MGASQRKEAVEYFTGVARAAEPPAETEFVSELARFQRGLCSGCQLYSIARPIVLELLQKEEQQGGRVRWLFQMGCNLLEPCIGSNNISAAGENATAMLTLLELVVRHVYGATHGQSIRLLEMIEGSATDSNNKSHEGSESTAAAQGGPGASAGARLCELLLTCIVKTPLTPATALLHAAVVRLQLTMTSSALRHSTQFDHQHIDVFAEMIMSSGTLPAVMAALLQRVVDWGEDRSALSSSPVLYMDGYQPSVRNLFNLFGQSAPKEVKAASSQRGGKKSTAAQLIPSCGSGEMVGRHSAALVVALVMHQKGNGRNPALDYLKSIKDGSPVTFASLLRAVQLKLTVCPCLCALVYALFYDHPTFLHSVLWHPSHSQVLLDVIQQILQLMYTAFMEADSPPALGAKTDDSEVSVDDDAPLTEASLGLLMVECVQYSYPFIRFMTSTLVLLLSQDSVVNKLVCDTVCKPAFNTDKYVGNYAIGSLIIIVLCTSITKALNDRNESLCSMIVPCMANLSAFVHDMDAYTAQRLMALLTTLIKKIRRTQDSYDAVILARAPEAMKAGESEGQSASQTSTVAAPSITAADLAKVKSLGEMYLQQLNILVEAVEGMVRGRGRNNESVIYELLYNRDNIIFSGDACTSTGDGKAAPSFKGAVNQIVANLAEMIRYYEAEIASAEEAQSERNIMSVIRRTSGGDSTAAGAGAAAGEGTGVSASAAGSAAGGPYTDPSAVAAGKGLDLAYAYEESPHSYDFFGPFVWSTLLEDARRPGGVLWARRISDLTVFAR